MLFNSYEFILIFLPITMLGYWVAERFRGRPAGIVWLVFASLVFYGYSEPWHLLVILPSILFNFVAGVRLAGNGGNRALLASAITVNLLLLGYFKYAGFIAESLSGLLPVPAGLIEVTLPAGISFYTFTQIAFLVDSHNKAASEVNLVRYGLFVTFFPHLIAGPIIHHSEMLPQFARDRNTMTIRNVAIGLSIFSIGLAKKVLLADNLALFASPVFGAAATGQAITFFESWAASIAYSLQLYFDFSGYSDMAIGLSLLFGVRMPVNFNSPYKARSIIDFWRRWHMTLSRFLLRYLYIPLGGNRHGQVRLFMALATTMVLGGLWHGAGWTFAVWGGLHGLYLIVNHGWRSVSRANCALMAILRQIVYAVSWPLTLVSVCLAWVVFRAETFDAALVFYDAMLGGVGLSFPAAAEIKLGPFAGIMTKIGFTFVGANIIALEDWREMGAVIILLGLVVCLVFPNTQEVFSRVRPALPIYGPIRVIQRQSPWRWRPTIPWAAALAISGAVSLMSLHRISEFIYFRF